MREICDSQWARFYFLNSINARTRKIGSWISRVLGEGWGKVLAGQIEKLKDEFMG